MKRLILGLLLVNLLWAVGLAEDAGYIVTDLKGSPVLEEPSDVYPGPLKLLAKLKSGTIVLEPGEQITLTALGDGSRIIATGPLEGRLSSKGFTKSKGAGSVRKKEGRVGGTSQLRDVSSTMGAITVRDSEPLLISRGKLLHPELVWLPTSIFPNCKLTLSRGDDFYKEWPRVESTQPLTPQILDLSDLGLEAQEPYFLTYVPLRKDGTTDEDKVVKTDVTFVGSESIEDALLEEKKSRDIYDEDPTDLTPLTVYLAYLVNQSLFSDAFQLALEDSFKEQGSYRSILRETLKQIRY